MIRLIKSTEEALAFLEELGQWVDTHPDSPVALDFETTSLDPSEGVVRLTQIAFSSQVVIIDHFYAAPFDVLCLDIIDATDCYYVFNVQFEGSWFDYYEPNKVVLRDVGLMRKAVMGGGFLSLKLQAKLDLSIDLDKDLQNSDWTKKELDPEQYEYAADDAVVTKKLALYWLNTMTEAQWNGFEVMNNSWRAVVEAEQSGMLLDIEHHKKLVAMWERRKDASERTLRKWVPTTALENLRSRKQISNFLREVVDADVIAVWPQTAKTGQLNTKRAILRQFSYRFDYPFSRWLSALMVFTRAEKYLGTYGNKLISTQELRGRLYPRLNMAQAITGRFSSSGDMNEQNLPRNPLVRRSFIANKGTKLVIADYSGIELRVLAELSQDEQMLTDVIYGDVHAESAITIRKFDREEFLEAVRKKDPWAKAQRSAAKNFSFQVTYGAGVPALAVTMRCTDEEAAFYLKEWGTRYNKAYNYRNLMMEHMVKTGGFLPCKSGRTIYVPKADRSMPVASNYPIQGSAADVMYSAMTELHHALNIANIPAVILASVHDELLVQADDDYVDEAKAILVSSMERGWLNIFPDTSTHRLVECEAGDSWAAKP